MGFNKRIIDRNFIEEWIKQNKTFEDIFNVGAIIFLDRYSSYAYELFLKKYEDKDILIELEKLS